MHPYTPRGVKCVQGIHTGPMISAGSRAQLRHGIASDHHPSQGLHSWDIALRRDVGPIGRESFIKDTERDLHDAVSLDFDSACISY